jgi:sugar phosphate isomerase/epimerase
MKIEQIGAQLYTCRDLLKTPKDIAATLRRVRQAGYRAVQLSGLGPIAEDELNAILDGEGLVCCATHEPSNEILEQPQRVIERLQNLRCTLTAYPYPAGVDLGDRQAVTALVRGLDKAGSALAAAGITLCYHNHSLEFRRMGGRTILEQIYEGTDPAHLKGEPDTYWIQHGGGDNVEWCGRLEGRLPVIHLKDYMIDDNNQPAYCEVGLGNLNFGKILPAAERAGCQWFVVEQDTCPGDPVESLAVSFRHLSENFCS